MNKICDIRKPVNLGLKNRLVKLIGSKPIINCKINGTESEVLLDTGSQVTMCDKAWLSTHAPGVEMRPVAEFLEQGEEVKFWRQTILRSRSREPSYWILLWAHSVFQSRS